MYTQEYNRVTSEDEIEQVNRLHHRQECPSVERPSLNCSDGSLKNTNSSNSVTGILEQRVCEVEKFDPNSPVPLVPIPDQQSGAHNVDPNQPGPEVGGADNDEVCPEKDVSDEDDIQAKEIKPTKPSVYLDNRKQKLKANKPNNKYNKMKIIKLIHKNYKDVKESLKGEKNPIHAWALIYSILCVWLEDVVFFHNGTGDSWPQEETFFRELYDEILSKSRIRFLFLKNGNNSGHFISSTAYVHKNGNKIKLHVSLFDPAGSEKNLDPNGYCKSFLEFLKKGIKKYEEFKDVEMEFSLTEHSRQKRDLNNCGPLVFLYFAHCHASERPLTEIKWGKKEEECEVIRTLMDILLMDFDAPYAQIYTHYDVLLNPHFYYDIRIRMQLELMHREFINKCKQYFAQCSALKASMPNINWGSEEVLRMRMELSYMDIGTAKGEKIHFIFEILLMVEFYEDIWVLIKLEQMLMEREVIKKNMQYRLNALILKNKLLQLKLRERDCSLIEVEEINLQRQFASENFNVPVKPYRAPANPLVENDLTDYIHIASVFLLNGMIAKKILVENTREKNTRGKYS